MSDEVSGRVLTRSPREDAAMTDKKCSVCGRPAEYRVYPDDDPDLMNEGWYVCELHIEEMRQHGHGVELDRPWGSP